MDEQQILILKLSQGGSTSNTLTCNSVTSDSAWDDADALRRGGISTQLLRNCMALSCNLCIQKWSVESAKAELLIPAEYVEV